MVKRETEIAAAYVTSQLKSLTLVQTRSFCRAFARELQTRYQRHWYPDCPMRGQALRSLLIDASAGLIDTTVLKAASLVGLDKIANHLPNHPIQLWIDPGEVEVCNPRDSSSNQVVFKTTKFHTYSASHLEPLLAGAFGSSIAVSSPSDAQLGCADQARSHKPITLSRHNFEQRSVH
eukprot:TRINITY_DN103_c0_g1_i1.p1 TRINITY_DN103_c0_g1~~TRINITY_DN103_c0_g1_i1.p1  ORF type:complete len:177 (-),score=58.61 TRINITY_DN103_c0_g1_i1:383-913(-)